MLQRLPVVSKPLELGSCSRNAHLKRDVLPLVNAGRRRRRTACNQRRIGKKLLQADPCNCVSVRRARERRSIRHIAEITRANNLEYTVRAGIDVIPNCHIALIWQMVLSKTNSGIVGPEV